MMPSNVSPAPPAGLLRLEPRQHDRVQGRGLLGSLPGAAARGAALQVGGPNVQVASNGPRRPPPPRSSPSPITGPQIARRPAGSSCWASRASGRRWATPGSPRSWRRWRASSTPRILPTLATTRTRRRRWRRRRRCGRAAAAARPFGHHPALPCSLQLGFLAVCSARVPQATLWCSRRTICPAAALPPPRRRHRPPLSPPAAPAAGHRGPGAGAPQALPKRQDVPAQFLVPRHAAACGARRRDAHLHSGQVRGGGGWVAAPRGAGVAALPWAALQRSAASGAAALDCRGLLGRLALHRRGPDPKRRRQLARARQRG